MHLQEIKVITSKSFTSIHSFPVDTCLLDIFYYNRPAFCMQKNVWDKTSFIKDLCKDPIWKYFKCYIVAAVTNTLHQCTLNLWNSSWLIRKISSATFLPYLTFLSSLLNYNLSFSSINKLIADFDVDALATHSKSVSISLIIFSSFLLLLGIALLMGCMIFVSFRLVLLFSNTSPTNIQKSFSYHLQWPILLFPS